MDIVRPRAVAEPAVRAPVRPGADCVGAAAALRAARLVTPTPAPIASALPRSVRRLNLLSSGSCTAARPDPCCCTTRSLLALAVDGVASEASGRHDAGHARVLARAPHDPRGPSGEVRVNAHIRIAATVSTGAGFS